MLTHLSERSEATTVPSRFAEDLSEGPVAGTNFEDVGAEKLLHHPQDPRRIVICAIEAIERFRQLAICR